MQLTSLYFILFFLPAVLLLYHLAGRAGARASRMVLLAASLLFCGLTDLWSLLVLLGEIVVGLLFAHAILHAGPGTRRAKAFLAAGIAAQTAVLAGFKYMGFLVGSIGVLLQRDLVWQDLILPLGISYTTFTQIAFLTDCYRGRLSAPPSALSYALYLSFFPKLAQGPITSGTELLDAFSAKQAPAVTAEGLADGMMLFSLGLAKKVLLADRFGAAVDTVLPYFGLLSRMDVLLLILFYSFQIYFDFSGYSDMAIGVARMLGYRLPVNFNSPYRSVSVTEFWRRWHMSLTGFLREYLYFPLGGSRRGTARTCLNILIVFLVSGLWHGANWTFLLWGLLHGLLQICERLIKPVLERLPRFLRGAGTFIAVSVLWLLFRCDSLLHFLELIMILIFSPVMTVRPEFFEAIHIPGIRSIAGKFGLALTDAGAGAAAIVLYLAVAFVICLQKRNNESGPYRKNAWTLVLAASLFLICLLSVNTTATFIYTSF